MIRILTVGVQVVGDQVAPAMNPEVLGEVVVVKAYNNRVYPLVRQLTSLVCYIVLKNLALEAPSL